MRYFSHLNTAASIVQAYDGSIPFHHYLREFLRADKKYGSSDRRNIARLCYAVFRLGKAFTGWRVSDRIIAGLYICTTEPDKLTEALITQPAFKVNAIVTDKWNVLEDYYKTGKSLIPEPGKQNASPVTVVVNRSDANGLSALFPSDSPAFSDGLDAEAFYCSFFVQPDLFIRIRPGKESMVTAKLKAQNIPFESLPHSAVRLSAGTKLEDLFVPDKEVVIQDYSSQKTISLIQELTVTNVWDACAASGGKSLLVWDEFSKIDLTVTDVRASIIANLKKRFQQAGISRYRSFVADLSSDSPLSFSISPDLIIADLPCTGSGTWSRTPEQLAFFEADSINRYQQLQQKILRKLVNKLPKGSHLLYITCSVFKKENEENIIFMEEQLNLTCLRQELITGYQHRADTMFAALLQSPH